MAQKSPNAFRTISEVASILDVPAHVLRFWESKFSQIKPVKRGGGRRYYRPNDINLIRGIRDLLYDDGLTIKGAQKVLRERGVKHVIALGTGADAADGPSDAAVSYPIHVETNHETSHETSNGAFDAGDITQSAPVPPPAPAPKTNAPAFMEDAKQFDMTTKKSKPAPTQVVDLFSGLDDELDIDPAELLSSEDVKAALGTPPDADDDPQKTRLRQIYGQLEVLREKMVQSL